jgi:hypothetical protein
MLGVPVIDRGPIELRAEITFHLRYEIAGKRVQIGQLESIVGRDDEAEMMPIIGAPVGEVPGVTILPIGVEHARGLAVFGDALAAEVAQVRRKRR